MSEATPTPSPTLPLGSDHEFDPEKLVGTVLDGRYRLIEHLASGGMGAVFRAEHVNMEKTLAVKVLRPELTMSQEIVERFRREARIYASLDHPNIVRVSDFGRTPEGMLFLAMEYLEGESLRARLDRDRALTPEEALPILVDVASALAAAHERGIVHRDLKPENIHVARLQDRTVVKVLDFGIARVISSPAGDLTRLGSVLGTPKYIAPEQAVGLRVDARADVYALGLLAWSMLAGRHPYEGREATQMLLAQATEPVPPLGSVRPELASHPLTPVIAMACAKDADERHPDGAALEAAFAECLAGRAPRAEVLAPKAAAPAPWWTLALPILEQTIALAVLAVVLVASLLTNHLRAEARAERLLADGDAENARVLLAEAIEDDPDQPDLHRLFGRALHLLPDGAAPGIEAYDRAHRLRPESVAGEAVIADLVGDLARGAKTARAAAELIERIGGPAVPALVRAADDGPPLVRARALLLLGAMETTRGVDRMSGFSALLSQPDCHARRIAARALGDLGDPDALPALRELAKKRKRERDCGGEEAARAIRKIEDQRRR